MGGIWREGEMTNAQMRFEAAKAMMQSIVSNPQWDKCHWDVIAEASVDAADCLIDALARYPSTEESSAVPDNDGWIHHTPGDPMPCNEMTEVQVMFPDGEVLGGRAGYWQDQASDVENPSGNWGKCEGCTNDAIVAWKPAKKP